MTNLPETTAASLLEVALQQVAPTGVCVGTRAIVVGDRSSLMGGELRALGDAPPHRLDEFACGRELMRCLLGQRIEILVRPDGGPDLPSFVAGTLAHGDGIAVAAVADARRIPALGIDVEMEATLGPRLAEIVCRWDERNLEPLAVFVAKEAVYKAWRSHVGARSLLHREVRVSPHDHGGFRAEVLTDGSVYDGSLTRCASRIAALVTPAGA